MRRVTNFGDPDYEPTDEELAELMHEAFADVPARSAAALTKVHEEVARLREEAFIWLRQYRGDAK